MYLVSPHIADCVRISQQAARAYFDFECTWRAFDFEKIVTSPVIGRAGDS
jgi:hypothetical protein